jgi:hypothetical protein
MTTKKHATALQEQKQILRLGRRMTTKKQKQKQKQSQRQTQM